GYFDQLPLKALRLFYSSVRFNFTIYHLKKVLPFYEQGILNNKTLPFENVAEIKKYNDQFNALKAELADIEDNIRVKQALLTITDQALTEVDLAEKQIEVFKQDLSKNLFGKTVLKPDDLDRFKIVLGTSCWVR
ncbi:hypothetical protein MTO74_10785, partial [Leuconostoc mesenteroides]|nr:hypothetical protein [Leuconostoc mesenteroides]